MNLMPLYLLGVMLGASVLALLVARLVRRRRSKRRADVWMRRRASNDRAWASRNDIRL